MSEPGGSIGRAREEVLSDGLATVMRYLRGRQLAAACDPDAVTNPATGLCECQRCAELNKIIKQGNEALLYQEEEEHA